MEELVLRIKSLIDKLNALKDALSDEQLMIYNESLNKAKQKTIERFSNNDSVPQKLIDELYR